MRSYEMTKEVAAVVVTVSTRRMDQPEMLAGRRSSPARTPARRNRGRVGLAFILPTLLLLLSFLLLPLIAVIGLSFTDWNMVGTPRINGFQNYRDLASDAQFRQSLIVTAQVAVGVAVPTAALALVLAVVSSTVSARATRIYQSLVFLPVVLPSVVTTLIWGVLCQRDGLFNRLLGSDIAWLTDPDWALPALIMLLIWTNLGYFTVVLAAGVSDVPKECLEAASVDGAGPLRRFWYITLPLVRPVLLFVLVIAATEALTLFVQPYLLTGGGPGDATRTLSELVYETAFQFGRAGKASAMAVMLLLMASIVAVIQFRLLRRRD